MATTRLLRVLSVNAMPLPSLAWMEPLAFPLASELERFKTVETLNAFAMLLDTLSKAEHRAFATRQTNNI